MCEHCHSHEHGKTHTEKERLSIIPRIIAAIIILILAVITDSNSLVKFMLFLSAYLIAGSDVLLKAIKNIFKGKVFDENFLMGIATLGAFAIKEFPEAVTVMVLYQLGEYLQDKAVEKTRDSIIELMDIRADYANIEENGQLIRKAPEDININDVITVITGEKIPLDGIVIEGEALVDTSALTGESIPRTLKTGDSAISGFINKNGVIKIRVTKKFTDSTVSKILELVENQTGRKAKSEKFITKFARYYTPVVVLGAVLLAVIPPLFTGGGFSIWFERGLTFLVISCPCALVISIPMGFFAGIGAASKCGILIKGSSYLEALSHIGTIVFDKTGTLTKGVFKVTKSEPGNGVTKEELLLKAAMAEKYSNHPIAQSLKEACDEIVEVKADEISELAGLGVKARINGEIILAGSKGLMEKYGVQVNSPETVNGTIVYVAQDQKYLGYIVISDEIKEDSAFAISEIKKEVNDIVMLSGDTKESAEFTAKELGIEKVFAGLLPQDKVFKLEELCEEKSGGKSIVFVGDGINDAPVLTSADIGIAMGALGSDSAIEAADAVILDDKISKIPMGIKIAKKTMLIVKENIVLAIGIKVVFLILGAMGIMTMWGAVFADTGVTLLAVLNSLRALRASE